MHFTLQAVVLSLCALSIDASPTQLLPARRVDQTLARRAFAGGWPLAATTCPSEASVRCSENSFVNGACCPTGTVCKGLLTAPYCCPTNAECNTETHNFPVCSGKGEVMYLLGARGSDNYFCCKEGQIGMTPLNGYTGICRDSGSPPPASLLATVIAQYGATAVGANPTATAGPGATNTNAPGSSNSGSNAGSNGNGSGSQTAGAPGSNPTTIINNSSSSSSSSSSASASAVSSGSSLSTGAIAGIAIGGAAVIGIILALGWCYRSGRFSKDSNAATTAPVYSEQKDAATFQQNAPVYARTDSGGPQEWKSPVSQYSEIGGTTVNGGSGIVSPVSGRNELSP